MPKEAIVENKYPQITRTQLDLWLEDTTTRVYLQCLEWLREDIREAFPLAFVENNADLTLSRMSRQQGRLDTVLNLSDFKGVLNNFKMIKEDDHVQAVK